jgi:hypothetical protein
LLANPSTLVCGIYRKELRFFSVMALCWGVIISMVTRAIILVARYMCLATEGFSFIQLDLAIRPHPTLALNSGADPYPALCSRFVGLAVCACAEITSALGLLSRRETENATDDGLE